jgi:SAM-dependent methyltransferase
MAIVTPAERLLDWLTCTMAPMDDYEYRGLIAESWDLLRGDTSGWADRPFWRQLIERSGEPALDVGCGTGRILLDYLAQGVEIEGVDNSPEMLAICRRKAAALGLAPVLYEQEMDQLDLPRRYGTIVVPSSSFQLILDDAAAAETLRRLRAHLRPGGTLAMSIMTLSQEGDPEEWRLVRERVRPEDGLMVRRWSRSRYDAATELEHTGDRYELVRDGEVVHTELHERSPATRSYTQAAIAELGRAAGFEDVRVVSGFTDQPVKPDDTLFCVVARRPAEGAEAGG